MTTAVIFKGDARKDISNRIVEKFEGIVHSIALEYFEEEEVTLLYLFNYEFWELKKVFEGNYDWICNKGELLTKSYPMKNILEREYHLVVLEQGYGLWDLLGNTDEMGKTYRLFKSLESIMDYRVVVKYFESLVRGKNVQKSRTWKKHSLWLDQGSSSGPVDFDTLDELKEILKNKYRANRLVPISYSPWDSTDYDMKDACLIEDLTILYLYEKRKFAIY